MKITIEIDFDKNWNAYLYKDVRKQVISNILQPKNNELKFKIIENKAEELKAKLKEFLEPELDDDKETIHILTDIQLNELLIM